MPTIERKRTHRLGREGVRTAVQELAHKLEQKLGVQCKWEGDEARFARPGAKGSIRIDEQEVAITIELGLMLAPMKSMIEQKTDEYLNRFIA